MSTKYTYSIGNDTLNGIIDSEALTEEIQLSNITISLDYINVSDDVMDLWFKTDLSGPEQTTLTSVVGAHTGEPLIPNIWKRPSEQAISMVTDEGRLKVDIVYGSHTLSGTAHTGQLVDSQIPDEITRDDELTSVSGAIQTQIDLYSDHGNLSGLLHDDHTQYLLASGTRQLTGDWDAGDYSITTSSGYNWNDVELHLAGYTNITGLLTGGELTINSGDAHLVDVASGTAIHVNMTDRDNPHTNIVSWPDQTFDPTLSGVRSKWMGVDSVGTIVAEPSFSQVEKRGVSIIGRVWGNADTGVITGRGNYKVPAFSFGKSMEDIAYALGSINISGNVILASASTLKLARTAGESFRFSANWSTSNVSPNVMATSSENPIILYSYHVQNSTSVTTISEIDPDNYDLNGTKTTVPSAKWTVQRVYCFPNSTTHVVYGQTLYNTKSLAYDGIISEQPSLNLDILNGSVLRAYLLLKQGCDDITDENQAQIVQAFSEAGLVPGFTNHGLLGGLADDDHPQYLNLARGDTYYYRQEYIEQSENIIYNGPAEHSWTIRSVLSSGTVDTVHEGLDTLIDYMMRVGYSGRYTPENVISVSGSNVYIAAGTGIINDGSSSNHLYTTWEDTTISGAELAEGGWFVNVDSDGIVSLDTVMNTSPANIRLGLFWNFGAGNLGSVVSCPCLVHDVGNQILLNLLRQGPFIFDDTGRILLDSVNKKVLLATQANVQYATSDYILPAYNTRDDGGLDSTVVRMNYKSTDADWERDWRFQNPDHWAGEVQVDRWNDTTASGEVSLPFDCTFTNNSYSVTSTGDLTSYIDIDDSMYLVADSHHHVCVVSGVEWTGSQTNITLEHLYSGTGGTGASVLDKATPKLPAGKWTKHRFIRTLDGAFIGIYGQEYYDTEAEARSADQAAIPTAIQSSSVDVCQIVVTSGISDLTDYVIDYRTLPHSSGGGGGGGGAGTTSNHSELTGLGSDDHLQYSLINGTRNYTGIVSYNTPKTFTQDAQIVDKKYVDDKFPVDHGDLTGLGDDDHPQYLTEAEGDARYTTASGHNAQFGGNFFYTADATESSTSSTTFVEKLSITRSSLPSGTYRIGWYFEWDVSSESALYFARVQINDTDDIGTLASTAAAASASWTMTAGFHYEVITTGTIQIDIDYRCEVSNKTAYIRNARLELWRVE